MTSYTITVAPNDGSGNTTTITVDTSNGEALITDVQLHSATGLTAARMPSIDIGLLMQAVTSPQALPSPVVSPALADKPTQTVPTTARPTAATRATAPDAKTSDTAPATEVPVPAQPTDTAAQPAARVRRPRTAKKTAVATAAGKRTAVPRPAVKKAASSPAAVEETVVPTLAAKPRGRRGAGSGNAEATAAAAAPKRKTRAARNEIPAAGKEKVYRRMPDDFSAVATRLNSASAIAEHYRVPSHTAQGWLRRLRTATTS